MIKKVAVLFTVMCAALLSGCTAYQWRENPVVESTYKENNAITDKIEMSFAYKDFELIAPATKKQPATKVALPSNGIGFAGEKYIYFVSFGADELLKLNEIQKDIPLVSYKSKDYIRLELTHSNEPGVFARFNDRYQVQVKESKSLTPENKEKLKAAGFNSYSDVYKKSIEIKGVIIERSLINYPFVAKDKLNNDYVVQFYSRDAKEVFHPLNLAGNIIATPFTLVGDIIAIPALFTLMWVMTP